MTKLRALFGALASVFLILIFGTATHAGESNYTLTGTQSKVDGACVAALPRFAQSDCSYDASNPDAPPFRRPS